MCTNPKWLYKKGFRQEDTYQGYKGQAYELALYVPCGQCSQCQANRSNNWLVRNVYEAKEHEDKCFITLTYNNDNNPIILRKKDLQKFIKRLRYYLDKDNIKIRYFACGEYGERRRRPHYHIIIYGWQPKDLEYYKLSNRKNILYKSKFIENVWGMGIVSIQMFNQAEIAYISLYETNKDQSKTRKYIFKLREELKQAYLKRRKGEPNKKLQKRIEELTKELEEENAKWKKIKEFNTWSKSIGWKPFEEEYDSNNQKTFSHAIGEATIQTPSQWLKKLANKYGEINAIKELKRREEYARAEEDERDINSILKRANAKINNAKEALSLKEKTQEGTQSEL